MNVDSAMRRRKRRRLPPLLAALLLAVSLAHSASAQPRPLRAPGQAPFSAPADVPPANLLSRLPAVFVRAGAAETAAAGHAQGAERGVEAFRTVGPGAALWLKPGEAVLELPAPAGSAAEKIRLIFEGARADCLPRGEEPLPGRSSFFLGRDPEGWRTGVRHFRRVRYSEIYPGIDLVFYGTPEGVEYDFLAAPGADPQQIRIRVEGADSRRINARGGLLLEAGRRRLTQRRPAAYQMDPETPVEVRYALGSEGLIGFHLGPYDRRRALVIDPVLEFSTFLGGEFGEAGQAIEVDTEGFIYVAGLTQFGEFANGLPGFRAPGGSNFDVFVLKLSPGGQELIYVAVFGGSADDSTDSLAIDGEGAAYVAGTTFSPDFPMTPAAFQTGFGGGTRDAFAVKLTPDGTQLAYSTYLGGERFDNGEGVAVDSQGRAHVAGFTGSRDFPLTPDALRTELQGEQRDAWVSVLSGDGSELVFSTLLGGAGRDEALDVALDAGENVWLCGATSSPDFPVTPGASQTEPAGMSSAFIAKLAPGGADLLGASLLGGGGEDRAQALAIGPGGRAYLAGRTTSAGFPSTEGAFQPSFGGGATFGDAFAAIFEPDAESLAAATFLGGGTDEDGNSIAVGPEGLVTVSGWSGSPDFPVTGDAPQSELDELDDAFVAALRPDLSRLFFSTFLGGVKSDRAIAVARGPQGRLYATGNTGSANFPVTENALQPRLASGREAGDLFIARIELIPRPVFSSAGVVNGASFQGGAVAPGEIVSIFGSALSEERGRGLRLDAAGRVAGAIGDTQVLFNGVAAPLIFVREDQLGAVVPYDLAGSPEASVEVVRLGVASEAATVPVAATAPGVFTLNASGQGPGAILNQDFTVNSPFDPAPRGSVVMIFGTGEGQTRPPGVNGKLAAEPFPQPLAPVTVEMGGVEAKVTYAGGAPGLVAGVLQVNAQVPREAPRGFAVPVVVRVGGRASQTGVTLSVE